MDYKDILNTPDLSRVAFTGNYSDLHNLPQETINDIFFVNPIHLTINNQKRIIEIYPAYSTRDGFLTKEDWARFNNKSDFDGTWNSLSNKPNLQTVATTGDYNDLLNLPDLTSSLSGTNADMLDGYHASAFASLLHGHLWADISDPPTFDFINAPASTTDYEILSWSGTGGNAVRTGTGLYTDGSYNMLASGDVVAYQDGAYSGSIWDSIPVRYSVDYTSGYVQLEGDKETPTTGYFYGYTTAGGKGWYASTGGIGTYPDAGIVVSSGSTWGSPLAIANNTNNYLTTMTGTGFNGEANLTFDGSTLLATGDIKASGRIIGGGLTALDSEATIQGKVDTALDYQYLLRFKDEAGTVGFYITNGSAAGNFFPVFTGKVTSSLPALYFVANCVNGPASGGAILGFDARKNNGAAAAGEVAIGFFSGFGTYLTKIYGNGDLTTTGVVTASGGSSTNWNTAYSNSHASGSDNQNLSSVTTAGFTTRASSGAFDVANQATPGLEVYGGGTTEPAFITFHRPDVYAVKFGLDGTDLKVGGWSMGATSYVMVHSGNTATYALNWSGGSTSLVAATGRSSLGLGSAATYDYTSFEVAGAVSGHTSTYNHSDYNTAYSDRMKWDGGATGLDASTGRNSLSLANSATTTAATAATASTIALRDGSGDLTNRYNFASYNNTTDDTTTATVTYIMAKFGDNYHRSASATKVATFISGQTMNISGSSTSCTGNSATVTVGTTTDTTCSVGLFEDASGSLSPKTDGGLTYNATTDTLSCAGDIIAYVT